MWVPAHIGIAGNEMADFEARQATLGSMVYNAQSVAWDCWMNGRKVGKSLKQEYFRIPSFPMSLLDHGLRNRGLRKLISRIISGHCGVRAHLKRFSIFDGRMCVCLEDHKTVDHII
jgi:hypothetical protein